MGARAPAVRVQCRDCRWKTTVSAARVCWCERCGGELRRIPYGGKYRRRHR